MYDLETFISYLDLEKKPSLSVNYYPNQASQSPAMTLLSISKLNTSSNEEQFAFFYYFFLCMNVASSIRVTDIDLTQLLCVKI